MTCGQQVTSSLDTPGEFEYYTFEGTAGDTIDVSFVWLTGFFAEGVDANIWSPTNAYVGTVQGTSTQSFALGETGTYVIRVNARQVAGTGSYTLGLWCRFPTPEPVAADLTYGDQVTGSLATPGEFHYYTFEGMNGETIDLTLVWLTGFFAEGVDANVWSPTNAYVGTVQGTSAGSFELTETGTYLVRVNARQTSGTGTYRLGLWRRSPNPTPLTAALTCGQQVTSSLDTPGEFEYYTFEGTSGETIDLSLVWLTGFSAEGVDATVWSPTNVPLGTAQGTTTRSFTLTETGTYVIRVNARQVAGNRLVPPGLLVPVPDAHAADGGSDVRRDGARLARHSGRVRLLHLRGHLGRCGPAHAHLADGLRRRGRGRERVVADERLRRHRAGDRNPQPEPHGDRHLRRPRQREADRGHRDVRAPARLPVGPLAAESRRPAEQGTDPAPARPGPGDRVPDARGQRASSPGLPGGGRAAVFPESVTPLPAGGRGKGGPIDGSALSPSENDHAAGSGSGTTGPRGSERRYDHAF